jgi:hypothetical protein
VWQGIESSCLSYTNYLTKLIYSSQGMLLMNLKAFDQAIISFETAIFFNPLLAEDEMVSNGIKFCRQSLFSDITY